jgi:predicted HTH domain antitoxin
MAVRLDLPQDVLDAAGPQLQQDVLEGVLLKLVSEGRMSLGRAGTLLGMSRWEAVQWYTRHGLPYPNLTPDDLDDELRHAHQD